MKAQKRGPMFDCNVCMEIVLSLKLPLLLSCIFLQLGNRLLDYINIRIFRHLDPAS